MTKTVWITRTQPAADESAQAWTSAGFDPLTLPVLEVISISHEPLPVETLVLFTSKNGVAHYGGGPHRAICVGDATADKARAAGYKDVVSVDGTSADVTAWVRDNFPTSQPVCHVSGWHVRGSITEDLMALGYPATRLKTYRSFPIETWPEAGFDMAALYSPLAAEVFARNAVGRDMAGVTVACISPATAKELRGIVFKDVLVVTKPREDQLIFAAQSAC